MVKSLHEQLGLKQNLRVPEVDIARLSAPDFKAIARDNRQLHQEVMAWLGQLAKHPRTPAKARREYGVVQIYSLEAINQAPWWRCLVAELGPDGRPIIANPDRPDQAESIYFYPGIAPPRSLVEALDEMSGHRLSKRIDGGPTPANPAGAGGGAYLPRKRPIRR